MSTIPELRRELYEIYAFNPHLTRLKEIADELWRRPRELREIHRVYPPFTEEDGILCREWHRAHPHLTNLEIAEVHGFNPARVSEAIKGKRF
jgi:hypothetical protein